MVLNPWLLVADSVQSAVYQISRYGADVCVLAGFMDLMGDTI